MTKVIETLCTHCSHREVCSFKDEFLKAIEAVNDVLVDKSNGSFIQLHDIRWIKPVELICTYYIKKTQPLFQVWEAQP